MSSSREPLVAKDARFIPLTAITASPKRNRMPAKNMRLFAPLLILFAQSALAQAPTSSTVPGDEAIRQMLMTRVDVQKQATGIVLGIVEAKGRRIIAYGTMAAGDKRRLDGDTVFDIGSVTKVFTALLLSDMARRSEVSLNDPAAKYLSAGDVTLPTRDGEQITLADLAMHTSGLPLQPGNLISTNPNNPFAGYSIDLLYRFVSSIHSVPDMGRYEYSNVGYALLGNILSRIGHRSYTDLVRERITEPLGMNDTRVELSEEMKHRRATGHNKDIIPVPRWELGALESAGAYSSSVNDLVRFLEAILGYRKSPLLPAMKAMTETQRPIGGSSAVETALAWIVTTDQEKKIVWKDANVGGYRGFIGYEPNAGIGVAVLANAQTVIGVNDIGLHLLDSKVPVDLHKP